MPKGITKPAARKVSAERKALDPLARQWGELLATFRASTKDENGEFYTQASFAAALGVPQSSVSRWETGAWMPRDSYRIRIADLLNVDASVLFSLPHKPRRKAS